MKMKFPFLAAIFWLGFHSNAQNTFPYYQQWGSYAGGAGSVAQDFAYDATSIHADGQNNIYTKATILFQNGYDVNYYNQFVNGGGNTLSIINADNVSAHYESKFSASGQMLKGSYVGKEIGSSASFEHLIHIDAAQNFYYVKRLAGSVPNLSTPGTWLQNPASSTETYILSKYDSNQNLLWTTYFPNISWPFIRTDANQNVYLVSTVNEEIPGLSSSNVFQEQYINFSTNPSPSINSYIVKLNPSGQKIWGTYSVMIIQDLEVYNNGVYFFGSEALFMPNNYITAGTFQPDIQTDQIISRFDADTGKRVWGTYYGTPTASFSGFGVYDLEVNETGLYVSGYTTDSDYPTYFASTGAFKSQITGYADLFLSKFDYTGNRVWSTYFGSDGNDDIIGSPNLSILGNRLIITGNQYGTAHNISTPGAFNTTPTNSTYNMFFAEFDSNGNRKWCSYYGGNGNGPYGEQLNPKLLNDGSLILWGTTTSPTGIATPGTSFPAMLSPAVGMPYGFITKFNLREDQLGTSDIDKNSDIKLYDNPNNGNFYLSGTLLEKQNTQIRVFDSSGRLLKQQNMNKKKTHYFPMQQELSKGNYLLEISSDKGEKLKVFKMSVR